MSDRNLLLENLAEFCARVSALDPPRWLARDLIPAFGIGLWHGQPRDLKSMTALATLLDLARGRDVFGSPRFKVAKPVTVAFVTEEDSEHEIHCRTSWLCEGSGMPLTFFPLVRRGLNFDTPDHQQALIVWLQAVGAELVCFDPLRAFTANSDKGPADFQPVARFLRRIQNETDCHSILIVHHDVKPSRSLDQQGVRSRSHDASGGGVFSISDCPVSFEKTEWNRTNVRPEDYKFGADPKPFDLTFATPETFTPNGEPTFGAWVHPTVGGDVTASGERKLLRVMEGDPLSIPRTAREWAELGALRKESVAGELRRLHAKGAVRLLTGDEAAALGRSSRAALYGLPVAPADLPAGPQAARSVANSKAPRATLPAPLEARTAPLPPSAPAAPGQLAPPAETTAPPLVGGSVPSGVLAGNGNGRLPRESGAVSDPNPHPAGADEPFNPYLTANMAAGDGR